MMNSELHNAKHRESVRAENVALRWELMALEMSPDFIIAEHWAIKSLIAGLNQVVIPPENIIQIPGNDQYEMVRRFTRNGWMCVPRKKKAA